MQFDEGVSGPADDQTATPGRDGEAVEQLLSRAKDEGTAVLADITRAAVKRLLREGPEAALRATELYSDEEKEALAEALAAVSATAELLGRARVQAKANKYKRA